MPPSSASPPPPPGSSYGGGHERRASTHSAISVSYAYGAPSVGSPARGGGAPRSGASAGSPRRGHGGGDDDGGGTDDGRTAGTSLYSEFNAGGTGAEASTGRSKESAQVRYARMAQRRKDTGSSKPPPKPVQQQQQYGQVDTSVNIATAFATAMKEHPKEPERRRRVEVREDSEEEEQEEEEEEEEEGSGKETRIEQQSGGGKKRKKRSSKDPTFRHRAGETESDESLEGESEVELERKKNGKGVKRSKIGVEGTSTTTPQTSSKKNHNRRNSDNATYKPTGTSDLSSEEDSDATTTTGHRRRKSKGKGRGSIGASDAIPIGRRDGDVWFGKKRKGRRGARKSGGAEEGGEQGEEEEEDEHRHDGEEEYEEEEGGGGMQPEDRPQDDDDDAAQLPNTSIFLLPGSVSSNPNGNSNIASSSNGEPAHSPFNPNRSVSLDSTYNSLDRQSQDGSHDDFSTSGIPGNSYEYLDEARHAVEAERTIAALEKQRRERDAGTPSSSTTKRRNRFAPPPPTAGGLNGIAEEDSEREREGVPGSTGKKVGEAVRPLFRAGAWAWRTLSNPLLDWGKIWRAIGAVTLLVTLLAYALSSPKPSPAVTPPPSRSSHSWIPFFGSSPSPPFTAPSVPADSLAELISRLSILETAMGDLSSLSTTSRSETATDRKLLNLVSSQVTDLSASFDKERKLASKALNKIDSDATAASRELHQLVGTVQHELDALVARVKHLDTANVADRQELASLQKGVASVGKDIAALGKEVAQVAKDVKSGVEAERISRIALEAIEAKLPSKLVVRMDDRGQLVVDPAFWRHLKEAFVEKREVGRLVQDEVTRQVPLVVDSSKASSSSPPPPPPPQVIVKEPSWTEFLDANELSLRSWVASDLASRTTGSDAIITKKAFVDLLGRELKSLKSEFEDKVNENVQKIGEEILNKVNKQEDVRRKAAAEANAGGLASHLNPFHRSPKTANSGPEHVTIKSTDGQNISALIDSIVDSALLRYSKDVLARPDFALFTAGGRVVRSLTSPTYEPSPLTFSRRALAWVTGNQAPQGRPPVTALHPDNSPGSCWPFQGTVGQLGIQLSRRVVVSDVTLEHASVDVALDGEVASAPKEFEVWGVVDDKNDVQRLATYRREQSELKLSGQTPLDDTLEDEAPTSLPPSANHLLLARGTYDASLPSPIQSFPVTPMARQLAIPVQVVVVKVLSNHGEPNYTCLYRARVSGSTLVPTSPSA